MEEQNPMVSGAEPVQPTDEQHAAEAASEQMSDTARAEETGTAAIDPAAGDADKQAADPDEPEARPEVDEPAPDASSSDAPAGEAGAGDPSEEVIMQAVFNDGATPLFMPAVPAEMVTRKYKRQRRSNDGKPERLSLSYGHGRDIGNVRTNNEDSTLTFFVSQYNAENNPDFGLFVVADGAGGHEEGEQASLVVTNTLARIVSTQILQPMLLQHIVEDQAPIPPISEVLAEAVKAADKAVKESVPGGGSTLTAVVLIGDLAHFVHVGDSRAYLLTPPESDEDEPEMELLTRDHSVARRLQEIGQITEDQLSEHPEAGRLWKLIGLTENLEPDISTRRLPPQAHLLLCSDGLWNMVPQAQMKDILLEAASPQEAANKLIATANANGGVDNIAAVVIQML